MAVRTAIFVAVISPSLLCGAEFERIYRHGDPVGVRNVGSQGPIDFASWVDEQNIVFHTSAGEIACLSVRKGRLNRAMTGRITWIRRDEVSIRDWSLSRKTKRLAYLDENKNISVIDCTNGRRLFNADSRKFERMRRASDGFLFRLAIMPDDGRLIVCNFSTKYGRNGFILDSSYRRIESSFDIDASPREMTLSPNGERIAVVTENNVLCVRDLARNGDVSFRGNRLVNNSFAPDTDEIDAASFSDVRYDGRQTIVYTSHEVCFGTDTVFVEDFVARKVKSFDARSGGIEFDVAFSKQRIVLAGSSTELTLMDFDGNVLALKKKATLQWNSCVEFSPSAERVLVGSMDNTLSIFRIRK